MHVIPAAVQLRVLATFTNPPLTAESANMALCLMAAEQRG